MSALHGRLQSRRRCESAQVIYRVGYVWSGRQIHLQTKQRSDVNELGSNKLRHSVDGEQTITACIGLRMRPHSINYAFMYAYKLHKWK